MPFLTVHIRHSVGRHKGNFRTIQTDAVAICRLNILKVQIQTVVHCQIDFYIIFGYGRNISDFFQFGKDFMQSDRFFPVVGNQFVRRMRINRCVRTVDGDYFAGFDFFNDSVYFGNHRYIKRLGHNNNVHCRRTVFNHKSADTFVVIIHQICRSHCLGNNYNILVGRNLHGIVITGNKCPKFIGNITQIIQTFSQIRIIGCRQFVPHFFIDVFDGRFCRIAFFNIRIDFFVPAFIGRKHSVRFHNFGRVADIIAGLFDFGIKVGNHTFASFRQF